MDEIAKQLEAINKTLEMILTKLPHFPAFPVQPTYPQPITPQPTPTWPVPYYPQGPWVTSSGWCASDCQTSSLEGELK
jgi:hypothetical protein